MGKGFFRLKGMNLWPFMSKGIGSSGEPPDQKSYTLWLKDVFSHTLRPKNDESPTPFGLKAQTPIPCAPWTGNGPKSKILDSASRENF